MSIAAPREWFDGDYVTARDWNAYQQKVPPATGFVTAAAFAVTATGFTAIPGWQATITLPARCLCMVSYAALLSPATGNEVRATLALSGATVANPVDSGWGDVLMANATRNVDVTAVNMRPYVLEPGTTVVALNAYRANTASAATVTGCSIRVVPMRWA